MRFVSLVLGLGLEHSCPWPRECLSSERLSLAFASDFFCVLGLEPCVLDSTSAKYVKCSRALLQVTKRYLRTRAILLKIRERLLRRTCFEIRKNNSNFYVSTIYEPFEGGPRDKYLHAFLFNTALLGFLGYFLQLNNLWQILQVSFGDRNVCAHLLIGIRCEIMERHHMH